MPETRTIAAPAAQTAKPIALLVDDDRLILATLAHGLREGGFQTIETASSADALQICAKTPPSIVIVDYDLPGMTGLDIARALQANPSFPLVFLSAYGDDKIVDEAVKLGAMAYLVKPIDPARIVPTIRAVIQRFAEIAALRGESAQLGMALKATRATSIVVGLLMERLRLSERQAYDQLRHFCRSQNRKVTEVAAEILGATENLNSLLASIASVNSAKLRQSAPPH